MSYLAAKFAQPIQTCFSQWGEIIQHPSDSQWVIASDRARDLSLHASLVEDWLEIHADPGAAAENGRIRSALRWNGELDGAAKFTLGPASRSIGVRAEIPLNDEADIIPGLSTTLAGFGRAVSLVRDPSGGEADPMTNASVRSSNAGVEREPAPSLPQLLVEAGWPFTERAGGSCMAELDSRGDFRQALIKAEPDGGWSASVELAAWEEPAPASKDALAVLLLTAAGIVRMVRPVVEDSGDRMTARFEIRFSPDALPALLEQGLSSLSVACRLCGREADVLCNRRIAEKYLAVRHFKIE